MHPQPSEFNTALTVRISQLLGVQGIDDIKEGESFFFSEKKGSDGRYFTAHRLFFAGASHDHFGPENQEVDRRGHGDEKLTLLLSGSHRIEIERFESGKVECRFVEHRNGEESDVPGSVFFGPQRRLLFGDDGELAKHSQL